MGGLPPLAIMVGKYIGYKIGEDMPKDPEQHAADLVSAIMGA